MSWQGQQETCRAKRPFESQRQLHEGHPAHGAIAHREGDGVKVDAAADLGAGAPQEHGVPP